MLKKSTAQLGQSGAQPVSCLAQMTGMGRGVMARLHDSCLQAGFCGVQERFAAPRVRLDATARMAAEHHLSESR